MLSAVRLVAAAISVGLVMTACGATTKEYTVEQVKRAFAAQELRLHVRTYPSRSPRNRIKFLFKGGAGTLDADDAPLSVWVESTAEARKDYNELKRLKSSGYSVFQVLRRNVVAFNPNDALPTAKQRRQIRAAMASLPQLD